MQKYCNTFVKYCITFEIAILYCKILQYFSEVLQKYLNTFLSIAPIPEFDTYVWLSSIFKYSLFQSFYGSSKFCEVKLNVINSNECMCVCVPFNNVRN